MDMAKQNPYAKLKKIILASMILVPFVPFILILGIGYYYFKTSLETSTISNMKRIVENHRQMIDSFLEERKANLEFIISSYNFRDLTEPDIISQVFENLQKESNTFIDLGVFNEEGIHVAYQGPYMLTGRDYKKADWFNEVMKTNTYISDVFLGYRGVPHFVIALAREDGGKKWVIRATIDTQMFNDLVKKVRIGETGEAYILNSGGIFQTEHRSGGGLMEKDPDNIDVTSLDNNIRTFIQKDKNGDNYLYATTGLKDKQWLLVVRQEKTDAFKALHSASYLILLIMIIGGVAIISIAFYLTDVIIKRMEKTDAEKDQLGQQLIRAGRLAEIGEMASGFAHEINNPLQIIKSEQALVETIMTELKDAGELAESESLAEMEDSIDQIKAQVDRCAKITQAILKFGRKSEPLSKDFDLLTFLSEVIGMVENKAGVQGIRIKEELPQDVPRIHADQAQLQQVFINLFNNAIDAIVERHGAKGGDIVVEVSPTDHGRIQMVVKDNGCGISPENLKRIFTPFFTTKSGGKGTGLGLSVCYGIVKNLGGSIEVLSKEGIGSTVTINLPAGIN
jgi:two-component system NtrC family sensor kinase